MKIECEEDQDDYLELDKYNKTLKVYICEVGNTTRIVLDKAKALQLSTALMHWFNTGEVLP
ncbi:hypothetical protein [Xanthomonas phage XAJ2]|uniref:Uncharacterized protein n=1 Tax=Xanthomonas phage XAJ2 TaxID=1775249 RepID=A0A1I9L2J5_9CAUD|nr:hypothetical protein [Xanthomonas phage XAJ2]